MDIFSEHRYIKNSDGTFNILEVPIFELGNHQGITYNDSWIKAALLNFEDLKKKEFLPRVIIGHTKEGTEKPAVGFLDNLKLQGKRVYADLIGLAEKTFNEVRTKAWPGRSVEVNPSKKKFTALALLGGTEPYFQFEPIDVKFEEDPGGEWVEFEDRYEDKKAIIEGIWSKMMEIFKLNKNNNFGEGDMTADEIKKLTTDITAQVKSDLQKEFDQKFEEQYTTRFKEEFGDDPKDFKEKIKKHSVQKFEEKKKDTLEKIKKLNLCPAIINGFMEPLIETIGAEAESIKFAEKEEGTVFDLIGKLGESLKSHFENETLFVDLEEYAKFGGDGGNPNLRNSGLDISNLSEEDARKLDKEIMSFQEKHGIKDYAEAAEKYLQFKESGKS